MGNTLFDKCLRTSVGDMPCSTSCVSFYFRMLERGSETGQPSTARQMRLKVVAGGNARKVQWLESFASLFSYYSARLLASLLGISISPEALWLSFLP